MLPSFPSFGYFWDYLYKKYKFVFLVAFIIVMVKKCEKNMLKNYNKNCTGSN